MIVIVFRARLKPEVDQEEFARLQREVSAEEVR
jgi:hypothetical protein